MSDTIKYFLEESKMPKTWYNIAADLPKPLDPVLHPGTLKPIGPDDLAPLFPMALIGQEVSQDREIEIQIFASEIISLQEKRFGPKGDMIIQRSKLIQPVQDQVLSIVKQIAEEKKYDFIFDRSSSVTMLYSAKNYDISDLVIKRINRQQRIQNRKDQIEKLKSKSSSLNN